MNKKVLLLGANSQLGFDIEKVLTNVKLISLTREDMDIEIDDIKIKLSKFKNFDYIINTISYNLVDIAKDEYKKAFCINSFFVFEVAKFCNQNSIKLFHFSTDYVFDGKANTPYKETDSTNPISTYGNSKLSGELFIKSYAKEYFIFRLSSLFGVAGSSSKGSNFIETMIKLAKDGKVLKVIDNQFMSPTHTIDVARVIKTFIDKDIREYGVYHICNSGKCSWYEFTKTIFKLENIEANLSPISYEEYNFKEKRPKYSIMDNSKVSKFYKLKSWQEALREYLKLRNR